MIDVSYVYLDVDNEFIHVKVTGTAAAPLVNLFKDFFLTWIKDEVIMAIKPLLTDLFPASINGMDALKAALTDLPGDF